MTDLMTDILIGREIWTETHSHTGSMPCEDGGKDWSEVSMSQGISRIASPTRNWEELRKDPHLEPSESMFLLTP